jgi:nicotinate-nucleotide adenylyltransferase
MRLGIFGGSFDPVHNGHIALAQACQHQEGLDEVWFMPTAVQPLKQQGPHATDVQRLEMLRLATLPEPSWRVSTLEIDRGGLSYTVDTLRQIGEEIPEAVLFFLMGADAVQDVPHWREPHVIFSLATPLVVHRAGEPEPDLEMLRTFCAANKHPQRIEMPDVEVSSSEIRRRVSTGASIDGLLLPSVEAYIAADGLYQE